MYVNVFTNSISWGRSSKLKIGCKKYRNCINYLFDNKNKYTSTKKSKFFVFDLECNFPFLFSKRRNIYNVDLPYIHSLCMIPLSISPVKNQKEFDKSRNKYVFESKLLKNQKKKNLKYLQEQKALITSFLESHDNNNVYIAHYGLYHDFQILSLWIRMFFPDKKIKFNILDTWTLPNVHCNKRKTNLNLFKHYMNAKEFNWLSKSVHDPFADCLMLKLWFCLIFNEIPIEYIHTLTLKSFSKPLIAFNQNAI